jgi:hypothetical protein
MYALREVGRIKTRGVKGLSEFMLSFVLRKIAFMLVTLSVMFTLAPASISADTTSK